MEQWSSTLVASACPCVTKGQWSSLLCRHWHGHPGLAGVLNCGLHSFQPFEYVDLISGLSSKENQLHIRWLIVELFSLLVVKKWYWSDIWPLFVAYSNPLRHIHGLAINFGITVWWCRSDDRQMWTPGITSWSRTIAQCLCGMLLILQSLCSKVSRMACWDCGVCNPSLWVTV